jgi:hypothetical protein
VTRRPGHLVLGAFGLALGFVLSQAGFTDWRELHRMLGLGLAHGGPGTADLRLMAAFSGGVALAAAGFLLLARGDALPRSRVRAGTIPGALLFGAGWALAGACPGAVLVQVGEGRMGALASLAGILAGSWAHRQVARRLGWTAGSCSGPG